MYQQIKILFCRKTGSGSITQVLPEPIPTGRNFGPDQIDSICRRQIKWNKNDNFCL